jgi:predicted ATPase/serine/threonine protein kinase
VTTPERWQEVKKVLAGALEKAPAERSVYLDQACTDADLRREVESLMEAQECGDGDLLEAATMTSVPLAKGTQLGQYTIVALIGAGGMGEVYRARDTRLNRDVAIKLLPSFLSADRDRLRRFEQEARAAAALNHPNILTVFQMGTHEDAPYMVSELLEGGTLREQLKRGPLPIRRVIDYGVQIARGLAAAHERGIVHRDLKPENLFVTKDGRVKILDFGLAKLTQRAWTIDGKAPTISDLTEPGAVLGTVGYMSPEQVSGKAADHRADIFAFGAVLYEMLTGKRAFQKPTPPETMSAILNEDPPAVSQLAPATPPALQRLVRHCLEKGLEQRFHSASDLAFALEALSETAPTSPPAKVPLAKSAGRRMYLPTPQTSLIGREREVADASGLLLRPNVRLLTLTGAGGAGKTRLAIAVASAAADNFTGGVQFVGLASITHPDLVGTAITKTLGLRQVSSRTVPELIADHLRDLGPFLLVLDNFEQILPAASTLAEILKACPAVKILVSSRACLRIYGEQEFPVAPLGADAAMELFAQRATAVRPNFAINSENAEAIREICSRLDGLPLAIELAAARTKVLSPGAILVRLQSRLQLLTGGACDLPERQQTLRNTIEWSHDLLNEAEQMLFRRFAVFSGGGTLEATEAVCNTGLDLGIDPLEGLSSLVDKNLVQLVNRPELEPRFSMLETVREYALERLAASGEVTAVRRAHAAYCLVLAEEGNPELSPPDRAAWLSRCDIEIDNFRSALDGLFESRNLDWGLRLSMALFRFWDMREHLIEGRTYLEAVLRLAGEGYSKERARIAQFIGVLATAQGDFPADQHFLEQSFALYEQLSDQWGVAVSLNALAVSARDRGDYASAQYNFERSLACWRALSDKVSIARCLHNLANVVKVRGDYSSAQAALREATAIFEELGDSSGAAWSLNQQGDIARDEGDVVLARDLYQRALSAFRQAGDRWGVARSLVDLGYVYCEHGDYGAAHGAYREALGIFAELGHRRGIARALEGNACLAAAQGHAARALTLAGAAQHLRYLISAPLTEADQLKVDQKLVRAKESLGESAARDAWEKGSSIGLDEIVRYSFKESEIPTENSEGR